MKRRTFLRGAVAGSALSLAAGSGLLRPTRVLAATWPSNAFTATDVDSALQHLYGTSAIKESKDIKITANVQAEDGASVPVAVSTTLPNVEAISILVHKNSRPLAANVNLKGAASYFRSNVKMLKTSDVEFVIKSNGKLYSAKRKIKVTKGGCGG